MYTSSKRYSTPLHHFILLTHQPRNLLLPELLQPCISLFNINDTLPASILPQSLLQMPLFDNNTQLTITSTCTQTIHLLITWHADHTSVLRILIFFHTHTHTHCRNFAIYTIVLTLHRRISSLATYTPFWLLAIFCFACKVTSNRTALQLF